MLPPPNAATNRAVHLTAQPTAYKKPSIPVWTVWPMVCCCWIMKGELFTLHRQ
jgi:hypothetical protein